MPGTFTIGGRYLFDGSKSAAYGGAENMEAGIEITVPAGTFKDCVRVREQGLQDLKDITDKIWCPIGGLVHDTSDASSSFPTRCRRTTRPRTFQASGSCATNR